MFCTYLEECAQTAHIAIYELVRKDLKMVRYVYLLRTFCACAQYFAYDVHFAHMQNVVHKCAK